MGVMMATATEMQNNFGRYLNSVINGEQVIVTKNGKEVGRFVPKNAIVTSLTDSLTGILGESCDADTEREKELRKKYEITD